MTLRRVVFLGALLVYGAPVGCGDDASEAADTSGIGPPGGIIDVFTDGISLAGAAGALPSDEGGRSGAYGGSTGAAGDAGHGGTLSGGVSGGNRGGANAGGDSNAGGALTSGGRTGGGGNAQAGSWGGVENGGKSGAGFITSGPPSILFSQSGVSAVSLISSNLMQNPLSADTYKEWIAEVKNEGSTPACFLKAAIAFQASNGSSVIEFISYARGAAYQGSGLPSIPCVAPGQTGVFYSNDIGAEIRLTDIRTASVTFTSPAGDYVPHPAAPAVVSAGIAAHPQLGAGYWVVSGTLRARTPIRNIKIDVFPQSSTGLLLDQLVAIEPDFLLEDETWDYETSAYEGPMFFGFRQFVNFIDGAVAPYAPNAESPSDPELRAVREAQRLDAESAERRTHARSLGVPRG
jgi:hypothetical protein